MVLTHFLQASWDNGRRTFVDSRPSPEYRLKKVSVQTIAMLWCNSTVNLQVFLQGLFLGNAIRNYDCPCNGCPPSSIIEHEVDPNWQGYNYNGDNVIQLDAGNSLVCVGALSILLVFSSKLSSLH